MKEILILKESKNTIKNPSDLFGNIKKIDIDYTQENFIVIYLNTNNQVLSSEIVFKGGLNCCVIDPRTIFRKALINNSNSIIISHNHPSGNLEPSQEDKEIFNKLKEVGDVLDLKVLDSIIFNKKEYYSMK